ncbi:MAG: GIY-YIG nuclease family protein [Alphaproteobacteria bacterium]|nr:GIY-YIG nuclease family protein [Alphaproteobacteria bacterium]
MYYVYIMANREFGVFYTGVTSDLIRRVYEHKDGCADGFTKKYNVKNLVYFECHDEVLEAIKREKRIKRWTREYKINAIQRMNPEWNDLYETLV